MLKTKKLISILMIIFMLFSAIQPVLATSGTGTWTGGQYASNFCTTDSKNSSGIIIRRLTNVDTGERRTVFCAEHGIPFATGKNYSGSYYSVTDPTMKKVCKIAYFGWYKANPDYVVDGGIMDDSWAYDVRLSYVFTQQYIWEILGQSNATFIDGNIQSRYVDFKNDIENQINEMSKKPSFNDSTINIQAGESKTIEDTNGVFSQYNSIDKTQDGIRFIHTKGNNSLTISVDENTNLENYNISNRTFASWGLIKEDTEDLDTNIFFQFADGVQNQIYALNYNDPVALNFSLKIDLFGKLELTKLNTNNDLINGSKFRVKGNNYDNEIEVTNGKITIDKFKKGTYTIKESFAPQGYLIDNNSYSVTIKPNQTSTEAIINDEPKGEITLTKTDKYTGNSNRIIGTAHHGDATINGAVYTLYASEDIYNVAKTIKYFSKNDKIATFTFNQYGVATINISNDITVAKLKVENNSLKGLPLGIYYAKETTTPQGYNEDSNVYNYNLTYKDMNTSIIKLNNIAEEQVKRAKFEVIKVSTNDNSTADKIENAEFTAILTKYVDYYGSFENAQSHLNEMYQDEYSVFKTDENGHGISNFLAYGEYTVRETSTPSDRIETVKDFYINIDKESNGIIKEFVENDLPFESYIKLIKEDSKTGKKVILSNATFSLYRLNEETNEYERVTCKTGKETYDTWATDETGTAFTETKLKAGKYKVDEVKLPDGFLKLENPITFEVNLSNKTLEFDNDLDPYISVVIKNEQPTGNLLVNKKVELRKDVDKSLVNTLDLCKIKFKLSAKEDITDKADGEIIYNKDAEIGTYNLDKNGNLKVENLPMGKYKIQEIETLDGLALDNTEYEVNLEKKDDTTKVYTISKEITNQTTCVEISKTDITGDKELEGAKLTVIDENDNIVDSWTSTDKTHKIEGLVVEKTYTLKEEIAPDGFVKATDVKFTIQNNGDIQKVTMIDKVVEITKTDITTGKELEGATLSVTDEKGNVVDSWTSEKTPHIVKGLEEGKKYILTETSCPCGYEKTESINFEVTKNKETQKIVMKDMPILKNVIVNKIDIESKELIKDKFTFGIFSDSECKNLMEELKSNKEDGFVEFRNLRYGIYYIKETKSPKGYELSNRLAKVEINDKGIFVDDAQVEEKDNTISFDFEDTKLPTPKTGDTSHIKLAIGIVILSILGLAWIIIKFFKNKKK